MSDKSDKTKPGTPEPLLVPGGLEAFRQRVFSHPLMRDDRLPSIGRELAYAVTDIRQRVFEEAWSGQVQTPDLVTSIYGRDDVTGGDPLGRSEAGRATSPDTFSERCQATHDARPAAARGQEPERGDHGPDR